MITIEDKLNVFAKIVMEKAQKDYDEKIEIAKKENFEKLYIEKDKIESEFLVRKDKKIKDAEISQLRQIAKEEVAKKMELLIQREKILQDFYKELEKEANLFTQSGEYVAYLEKEISGIIFDLKSEEKVYIVLTKDDLQKYEELIINKFKDKIELGIGESIMIGGAIGLSENRKIKVNKSLASKINKKKEAIAFQLLKELNEQVNNYE